MRIDHGIGQMARRQNLVLAVRRHGEAIRRRIAVDGVEVLEVERLRRIIELGDKKHTVVPEDLPSIIADVLKAPAASRVKVESYRVTVAKGELPLAEVTVSYRGRTHKAQSVGDGGYDAFMKALAKTLEGSGIELPGLEDFRVRIPPGGRTEALVETLISWRYDDGGATFSTLGVDSDQMAAAVIATEKMLNAARGAGGVRETRHGFRRSRSRSSLSSPRAVI